MKVSFYALKNLSANYHIYHLSISHGLKKGYVYEVSDLANNIPQLVSMDTEKLSNTRSILNPINFAKNNLSFLKVLTYL